MKQVLLATLAVVALASGSALAADLPARPAPVYKAPAAVAPSYSWTGCYLDAGWGYGFYDERTQASQAGALVGAPLDQGGRGWLGRFGGGCDYQVAPAWVIGAFGDFDVENIHGLHTGQDGNIGLISGDDKLKDSWAVGGRIGYLVTPALLTYFDGGYTEARFGQITYANTTGALTGFAVPATTFKGWFVGGGTEYALNFSWLPIQGLFWRNEYRFAEYQSQSPAVFNTATGVPNGVVEATHPYVQTITSSLVWKFNFGGR